MLRLPITYTDPFTDEEETGVFHFHLNKTELVELETDSDGNGRGVSLTKQLARVSNDRPGEIIALFKRIIMKAYGEKEGASFVKSEKISETFMHHPAYDVLFMDLMTGKRDPAEFVKGIVPKDLVDQVETGVAKAQTVQLPKESPGEAKTAPKDPKEMSREELIDAFKNKTSV